MSCSNSILQFLLSLLVLIKSTTPQLTIPFPSLISEIQPSLAIYSPKGNPPCFILPTSTTPASYVSKDLVIIAGGHGAWLVPRVVFITHSFRENGNTPWLHEMKNAILEANPQTTVVIVGWGGGADNPNIRYNKAAGNIRSLGAWLGDFVVELKNIHPHLYIWGIGHSLGAHLMGVAGQRSHAWNRITGLDPSGPLFDGGKNDDLRLGSGDAQLVDVIHSDGCTVKNNPACWVTLNNHYSILQPLGTVDFYPGYGELNPNTNPHDIDKSHTRGVSLFIASIRNKGLFRTNLTIEGNPNPRPTHAGMQSSTIIKMVDVTAEMGYWLGTGFVPRPVDPRTNFYIPPDMLSIVDEMRDLTPNGGGGRGRRELVRMVDCVTVPNRAEQITAVITTALLLSLIIVVV